MKQPYGVVSFESNPSYHYVLMIIIEQFLLPKMEVLGPRYLMKSLFFSILADSIHFFFCFKYDLDSSTMLPKFNPTGDQTHDLQIMDGTFHAPENLVLTTEPSGTFFFQKKCSATLS